ncbi:hypothetical protein DK26_04955 [Bosea sp. WAO]|uniref:hypothetical protein n=1 Tax=Bosea sp. WAO TaxID=406341 RepID=UPI000746F628|nr:hypothetical protein [Bosea sp. WAO]KUL96224.1 hypothetical protein DK26_04955 [Bosea sp. WAO]
MARLQAGAGRLIAGALSAFLLVLTLPAAAEVRFGNNVRIGGHDASNQRFDRRNRGVYHLYEGRPRNPGCSWRSDGRGGRVKVCHLQRITRR